MAGDLSLASPPGPGQTTVMGPISGERLSQCPGGDGGAAPALTLGLQPLARAGSPHIPPLSSKLYSTDSPTGRPATQSGQGCQGTGGARGAGLTWPLAGSLQFPHRVQGSGEP